jgi:hypothetical protein
MDHGKDQHKGNGCGCKETPVKETPVSNVHGKDKAVSAEQHQVKPIVTPQHKK